MPIPSCNFAGWPQCPSDLTLGTASEEEEGSGSGSCERLQDFLAGGYVDLTPDMVRGKRGRPRPRSLEVKERKGGRES